MNIDRRGFLALTGAVSLTGALAACSGGGNGGAAAGGNIQFWNFFADADNEKYFREHFVRAHKGSKEVELTVKSADTIDRLTQTALAAGKGPDLILTPGPSQVAAYQSAGYLADLTEYAEKYKWNDVLAPWSLEASKIDGKLVTLPTQYESMAFYFNPAVLEKNKLTVPDSRESFEAFCTEAAAKGMVPIAAGNADWKGANEWHLSVFLNHHAGGEAMYSALTGKTAWTDPLFVDTIELLSGYFKKGWFGGSVDAYFTNQFPKLYKQLASGEAAGMVSGTWEMGNLGPYFGKEAGNDADWDWSTFPSLRKEVPNEVWDLGIGQSTGINSKSGDVAAAAEYLNFLATDVKTLTKAIEDVSWQATPLKLELADFSANADPRVSRLYTGLPVAKNIGYLTWTFFPQETETYLIQEFEKVITDKLSAKDFCAGIQQRFAKEFADGKVPTAPKPSGLAS